MSGQLRLANDGEECAPFQLVMIWDWDSDRRFRYSPLHGNVAALTTDFDETVLGKNAADVLSR